MTNLCVFFNTPAGTIIPNNNKRAALSPNKKEKNKQTKHEHLALSENNR